MTDHFLKTREEIKAWLDEMGIKGYTIHDNSLSVDVDGDVDITGYQLTAIPVQFGVVKGDFWCGSNRLTNLIGSPTVCRGCFFCYKNSLSSLAGVPKICKKINCKGNPDLHDVSAVMDGCELIYDRDVVAKNQAFRHLAALSAETTGCNDVSKANLGRRL